MATQMTPPAASAPPPSTSSVFDMVSAATAEPSTSSPASSEPSQADESGSTGSQDVSTETTGTETSVNAADTTAQTQQTEQQHEPNPYEVDDAETDIPPATLDTLLQTPRGKEIYQGYKAMRELGKPIAEGGIGHVPTIDQTRTYYGAYRDRALMDGDLSSGDPSKVGRFVNSYLFNPERGQANLGIAAQIAPSLTNQPELYAAVMEPFLGHYQQVLLDKFNETPETSKELKDALWFAATVLNKDLKGEYLKPPTNGKAPQNGQPQQPDPLAAERAQLAQERQQLEQMRGQSTQAQTRAWSGAYQNTVQTALMGELDKALAPLKTLHAKAPVMYQAARKQFHDDIVAAVNQNGPAMELFQVTRDNALRAGTRDSADYLAKAYVDMAIPAIRAARKKFLEGAGVGAQMQNNALHSELATIDANKTAGNGAGAAPGRGSGPPVQRNAGETHNDFIHRMVAAATKGRT